MMMLLLIAADLAAPPVTLSSNDHVDSEGRTAIVRFGDLDLTTTHGQNALDGRVERALSRVCSEAGPAFAEQRARTIDCMKKARVAARQQTGQAIMEARNRKTLRANQLASEDDPRRMLSIAESLRP